MFALNTSFICFFLLLPRWNKEKFLPSWDFPHCVLSQMLSALSFFHWNMFPGIQVFQISWKASNTCGKLAQLLKSRTCCLRYFHLVSLPWKDPCPFKTFFRAFIFVFWQRISAPVGLCSTWGGSDFIIFSCMLLLHGTEGNFNLICFVFEGDKSLKQREILSSVLNAPQCILQQVKQGNLLAPVTLWFSMIRAA